MKKIFYASLCHVCKQYSLDLKRCSICKTFAYCSKEHQKQDWQEHKHFCKVISKANSMITSYHQIDCDIEKWRRYRLELQAIWKILLKRDLHSYEYQVWMFPRVCAYCFSKDNLIDCQECLSVAYCVLHEEEIKRRVHKKNCEQLKLCREIEVLLASGKIQFPIVKCTPHLNEDIKQFPEDITQILKKCFIENDNNLIDFILKCECCSNFATIAHIIDKFIRNKTSLIIHVVGASSLEASTDWCSISQNLFHFFPIIETIEWILIGPEAHYYESKEDLNNNCNLCLEQNKHWTIKVYKNLYENCIDEIAIPNLVIAFNCGIHEFAKNDGDTWKTSIPYLLRHPDVPLLLTAYTKMEILEDLQCIHDCVNASKVLMEAQVNKYASLRPIRNWDDEENIISVFYTNGYIAVLTNNSINS